MRSTALLLFACLSAPASATVLADWSLEEVAARADRIDLGVVVDRVTVRIDGEIYTRVHLRVSRTLKGKSQPFVTVTQLGGTLDGETTELVGDAQLPVGAKVALMTRTSPSGDRHLVGMSLGAYGVNGKELVHKIEVSVVREGVLKPPPGVQRVPLSRLERAAR